MVLKEVVKMRSLGWALIQQDWGPYEKRRSGQAPQWEECVKTQEKAAVRKSTREAAGEIKPADTLILDFQLLEL